MTILDCFGDPQNNKVFVEMNTLVVKRSGMIKDAVLSKDRRYRYALWRIWNEEKPVVMFICLNPSTADEEQDDPTLIRCISYSKLWGYGGVIISNLFAFRATNPGDLKKVKDPMGDENDKWLKSLSEKADIIVGAWGNHGELLLRGRAVINIFEEMYCLKINKTGQPAHPLYQPKNLKPKKFLI